MKETRYKIMWKPKDAKCYTESAFITQHRERAEEEIARLRENFTDRDFCIGELSFEPETNAPS